MSTLIKIVFACKVSPDNFWSLVAILLMLVFFLLKIWFKLIVLIILMILYFMKLKHSPSYPTPNHFCPFDESFFREWSSFFWTFFLHFNPNLHPQRSVLGSRFSYMCPLTSWDLVLCQKRRNWAQSQSALTLGKSRSEKRGLPKLEIKRRAREVKLKAGTREQSFFSAFFWELKRGRWHQFEQGYFTIWF